MEALVPSMRGLTMVEWRELEALSTQHELMERETERIVHCEGLHFWLFKITCEDRFQIGSEDHLIQWRLRSLAEEDILETMTLPDDSLECGSKLRMKHEDHNSFVQPHNTCHDMLAEGIAKIVQAVLLQLATNMASQKEAEGLLAPGRFGPASRDFNKDLGENLHHTSSAVNTSIFYAVTIDEARKLDAFPSPNFFAILVDEAPKPPVRFELSSYLVIADQAPHSLQFSTSPVSLPSLEESTSEWAASISVSFDECIARTECSTSSSTVVDQSYGLRTVAQTVSGRAASLVQEFSFLRESIDSTIGTEVVPSSNTEGRVIPKNQPKVIIPSVMLETATKDLRNMEKVASIVRPLATISNTIRKFSYVGDFLRISPQTTLSIYRQFVVPEFIIRLYLDEQTFEILKLQKPKIASPIFDMKVSSGMSTRCSSCKPTNVQSGPIGIETPLRDDEEEDIESTSALPTASIPERSNEALNSKPSEDTETADTESNPMAALPHLPKLGDKDVQWYELATESDRAKAFFRSLNPITEQRLYVVFMNKLFYAQEKRTTEVAAWQEFLETNEFPFNNAYIARSYSSKEDLEASLLILGEGFCAAVGIADIQELYLAACRAYEEEVAAERELYTVIMPELTAKAQFDLKRKAFFENREYRRARAYGSIVDAIGEFDNARELISCTVPNGDLFGMPSPPEVSHDWSLDEYGTIMSGLTLDCVHFEDVIPIRILDSWNYHLRKTIFEGGTPPTKAPRSTSAADMRLLRQDFIAQNVLSLGDNEFSTRYRQPVSHPSPPSSHPLHPRHLRITFSKRFKILDKKIGKLIEHGVEKECTDASCEKCGKSPIFRFDRGNSAVSPSLFQSFDNGSLPLFGPLLGAPSRAPNAISPPMYNFGGSGTGNKPFAGFGDQSAPHASANTLNVVGDEAPDMGMTDDGSIADTEPFTELVRDENIPREEFLQHETSDAELFADTELFSKLDIDQSRENKTIGHNASSVLGKEPPSTTPQHTLDEDDGLPDYESEVEDYGSVSGFSDDETTTAAPTDATPISDGFASPFTPATTVETTPHPVFTPSRMPSQDKFSWTFGQGPGSNLFATSETTGIFNTPTPINRGTSRRTRGVKPASGRLSGRGKGFSNASSTHTQPPSSTPSFGAGTFSKSTFTFGGMTTEGSFHFNFNASQGDSEPLVPELNNNAPSEYINDNHHILEDKRTPECAE